MRKSFRISLILMAFLAITAVFADNPAGIIKLENFDLPSATTDDLFSPLINPSLLGAGRAGGMGWVHFKQELDWQDHYYFISNMDGLSYVYEHNDGVDHHTFATGGEFFAKHVFPNLYAGTSYGWENSHAGKGSFRSALTYRPHDGASLAFRWDNPYKEAPAYHAGLGVRPLAFFNPENDYRLELTADVDYRKDIAGDYAFEKPVLGISTELLDGVRIGGSYNLETEAPYLNFSLRSRSNSIGTSMRFEEGNNYGVGYIHLGESNFKPFLGLHGKNWYEMKLNGSVVAYKASKYKIGPIRIFDGKTKSIDQIIEDLQVAAKDPRVNGILLSNPSFSASFGLQQELVNAFKEFKSTGKKVAFYFDNITNGGYIFASGVADKIYLNPQGSLDLKGISIQSPYLKELLNTAGIEVLNFRSHPFKTAGNQFSESSMTPAEREMWESLLGSIYDQVLAQITAGRGDRLSAPIAGLIDNGPYYIADDALKAGLVDGLLYEDQLADQLKTDFAFNGRVSSPTKYADYSWSTPKESQIAVIYAQGNIVMGKGEAGQKIAHDTTVKMIRAARKNPAFKGIILRVDSGGGSAQASDIILREMTLAQTENKKPVVVSMAGVAGSGGYYISCNADKIIADPATLTGSIGVIGLAFNARDAFKKVKVNWSTVKKGNRSDFGSMSRAWTEDEKQIMTHLIETSYDDFVGKVDRGRKTMDIEQVRANAQGRVWTGEQALKIGLVDDLGGMDKALEHMRNLTGITGAIRLVDATSDNKGITMTMDSNPLSAFLPLDEISDLTEDYRQLYEMWDDFHTENTLMFSPYTSEIISFE